MPTRMSQPQSTNGVLLTEYFLITTQPTQQALITANDKNSQSTLNIEP